MESACGTRETAVYGYNTKEDFEGDDVQLHENSADFHAVFMM